LFHPPPGGVDGARQEASRISIPTPTRKSGTASELSFETAKDEVPGRTPVVGIEGTIGKE
jgi:hypothetical protein